MNEPAPLERLQNDHVRVAQVLTVLKSEIQKLDDGGESDFDLLATIVDYLGVYSVAAHHPLEERICDHLVNKGLTPSERQLVSVNLAQHIELIGLTRALAQEIAVVVEGSTTSRDRLKKSAEAYLELQRVHMRIEDQQLFPLLQRMFTREDWSRIEEVDQVVQKAMSEGSLARYQDLYRRAVHGQDDLTSSFDR